MIKKTSICLIVFSIFTLMQCKKTDTLCEIKKMQRNRGNRIEAEKFHKKALSEHKKENYIASENLWIQAIKADPSWGKMYFNMACTTALQKKPDEAIEYLEIALQLDLKKMIGPVRGDSDLKSLRNMESYKNLIKKYTGFKSMLIGKWGGSACEDRIPPGYKKKDMAPGASNISFGENSEYCIIEYAGFSACGTFLINGNIVKWNLEKYDNGMEEPSPINKNGSFRIDYQSPEFLCIKTIGKVSGYDKEGCFCKHK